MTDLRTTNDALERLLNVKTNPGALLSEVEEERIQGALQALQFVLGQQSYLITWIERYEGAIRADHAKTKVNPCTCEVCRVR